ncbi:hypothetical protein RUM44_012249 [Polyplax serrata]|uniref:Glucose-methanol-choline oxidoreductase N-terminal domain-containing protein n=1 Tax=Polyplax serrata TaxID=468196 RepID=A0ABR1BFP2_POLSC
MDSLAVKSALRITLSYGAGFGFILMARLLIKLTRPDIVADNERPIFKHSNELHDEYDFIIVGAGTAGSVIASRLSENTQWKVLVLEAGPDETILSDVPLFMAALQKSPIDWQFKTKPSDSACLGMKGKQCNWPRGKVLGGCSTINAMLYVRGNRRDYDIWGTENPGWDFANVFPYFIRSEDIRIDYLKWSPYHGKGGYQTVEEFRYHSPIVKEFLEAGRELGYPVRDINGARQTGFMKSQGTLRDGLRCSTAKAFLRPCRHRKNLDISINSFVEKIHINPYTRKAESVTFRTEYFGQKTIKARREIILTAGAIQSPQLLMLSGIGPKDHLREHNISVILDLPGVGENLQDHVALGGTAYLINNPDPQGVGPGFVLPKTLTLPAVQEFTNKRTGPLYGLPECEAMAFVHTKYSNPAMDWPDIQLFLASYADNTDGGIFGKRDSGLTDEYYAATFEKILYQDAYSVLPLLMRPKSRGTIRLKSSNPNDPPLIDPKYFDHPDDIKVLIEGAKFGYEMSRTSTMRAMNATLNPNGSPDCLKHGILTDAYWECQIRHYTMTIYHPVGTCKMGPSRDPMSVVDSRLRVHGIWNLRVADASIMPTITTGNTNAPVMMIAEKVSDLIKEDAYFQDRNWFPNMYMKYRKDEKDFNKPHETMQSETFRLHK